MHEKVLWILKRTRNEDNYFLLKKLKLLTKEQQKSYENAKTCYFRKENSENKCVQDKKYRKVKDYCHYTEEWRGAVHSISNLKYNVSKTIHIVFHNGSNYDYHFFIKELAKEFKKQFTSLGKNTEKYITFTDPENW